MDTLHLKVITPRKIVIDEQIVSVSVPTSEGEITILPHHQRLFSLLVEGIVKIKTEKKQDDLAIGGGYLETDGKKITILVSRAYGQNEIDQNLTQQALNNAKKILSHSKDQLEREEAAAILRRSTVDLKLLKRRRKWH